MTGGWAFVVLVCVWVPFRETLCLFWREIHTKGLRVRSLTRSEEDEGRKVQEIYRQERAVKRRSQSGEGSGRDQSTEQVSQEMRVGQRGDPSTEFRKAFAKTCWPTDAGLTNARILVSIPSGFVRVFARVHAHVSSQKAQKVSQTSPLGVNPSPCLFVCLFVYLFVCSFLPPSRLCWLRNLKYPWSEMRKTSRRF